MSKLTLATDIINAVARLLQFVSKDKSEITESMITTSEKINELAKIKEQNNDQ